MFPKICFSVFSYDNEEAEKEDRDEDDSESPSLASLIKEKVGKFLGEKCHSPREEQMAQAYKELSKHN